MEAAYPLPYESDSSSSGETREEFKYRILNSVEDRMEYVTLTDKLIQKIAAERADVAIYLDKSARPVAWMVNELWDTLAPRDEEGNIPPKPQTKFLNIDREQWGAIIGRSEDGGIDVKKLPADRLKELQELYGPVVGVSEPDDTSLLSDKNVLVIDEVRVSGDTLHMSESILRYAFPDAAKIEATYWMDGGVKVERRSGVRKNTKLPVWYSDTRSTGRGVADRDTSKSSASPSGRQRTGRYWLSTTFRDKIDQDGLDLRQEVKQLAQDIAEHKLLYRPTFGWNDDELDSRIERINGLTVEQYVGIIKSNPDDKEAQNTAYIELAQKNKRAKKAKEIGEIGLS